MKRKALLIANTNGLNGTKADLVKFSSFLHSLTGGAWEHSEIINPLYNPSKEQLLSIISHMKQTQYDYVIVLFSGHGGQRRETVIEINGNNETVNESELKKISPRQLTIFDCCRVIDKQFLRDSILSKSAMNFSSYDTSIREDIRRNYENRIMEAMPQQATLYSCSEGQSSYDTNKGAVYLSNLITAAESISNNEFMTIGEAHQKATRPTYEYSLNEDDGPQIPDARLPKCLHNQELIISINYKRYYSYS
jgi:hypothetical protein